MSDEKTKPVDNDPNSWKNREKGAIWQYEDKLSISLKNKDGQEVRLVAFKNKFKSESKHPDWRVYTELPKDVTASAPETKKPAKPVEKKEIKKTAPAPEPEEEFV